MAVKILADQRRDERRRTILREAEERYRHELLPRRGADAPSGPDQAAAQDAGHDGGVRGPSSNRPGRGIL